MLVESFIQKLSTFLFCHILCNKLSKLLIAPNDNNYNKYIRVYYLFIVLNLLTTNVDVSMKRSTQFTKHCSVLLSMRLGILSIHLSQQRSW